MKAKRVHYEGHVQGVGFRWATRRIAQGYDVTGQVKNLPDGRVELHVSGDEDEVSAFLKGIRESSLAGHIIKEHVEEISIPQSFKGFQIAE